MNKDKYILSFEVVDWILKHFVLFKDDAGVEQKIEISERTYLSLDYLREKSWLLARQKRCCFEHSDITVSNTCDSIRVRDIQGNFHEIPVPRSTGIKFRRLLK